MTVVVHCESQCYLSDKECGSVTCVTMLWESQGVWWCDMSYNVTGVTRSVVV